MSRATCARKACGVLGMGTAPLASKASRTEVCCSAVATAVRSVSTTAGGMPRGAINPIQLANSKPGRVSAMAGTGPSGRASRAMLWPSSRSRPAPTRPRAAGAGVAFQIAGGFESLHVPYKGGSQGVASVVSGETDWVLTPAPAAMSLVAAGRLRLLGHSMAASAQPLGAGVPAIASELSGFEFASWIGLMAPRGLPASAGEVLARAAAASLQRAEVLKAFETNGATPHASTSEEFRNYLVRDVEVNRRAVAAAGIQPE
jgi:hypothetical protein